MLIRFITISALCATPALAGPGSKVDLCHFDDDTGLFHVVNINESAVNAHLTNHGDAYPATWYPDADGDGYGDPDGLTDRCPQPGLVDNGTDCDETDAEVNPGATEVPYDGVDNDCNADSRDDDLDYDGFLRDEDCNDNDAAVNPAAAERAYDGLDNDCDPATPDDDLDADGFLVGEDCNDENAAVNPDAAEVCEDNMDNDCNDAIDDGCAVVSECPCFTAEQILQEYAEFQATNWQSRSQWCDEYEADGPWGTYNSTTIAFDGSSYDGQSHYETNRFFSIDYDAPSDSAYCSGRSSRSGGYYRTYYYAFGRWETVWIQSYSYGDFSAYQTLSEDEHLACEFLLVDTAAEIGMSCQ